MNGNNRFVANIKKSAGIRICILFGTFFFMLVISSILNSFVDSFDTLSKRNQLLLCSIIQSLFVFCIPAFFLARFCSRKPLRWLAFKNTFSFKAFIGVIIVYILAIPAMNQLIIWNSNLHLPDSLITIENYLRNMENNNAATTEILLNTNSIPGIITGILIIGVTTAIGEELFFRGSLQKIFVDSGISIGVSIWTAAFIFSFFHFQFFGFFPRLLMGVFFGYLLYWTRNIWIPIFAHALNNSIVVVGSSSYNESISSMQYHFENFGIETEGIPIIAIISGITTILFLYYLNAYFFRQQIIREKING